ncbi:hypothetical protein CF319_g151 [Tilletia indica]|nr:hypothetical protein CF319_g151 [Tilletia indica]
MAVERTFMLRGSGSSARRATDGIGLGAYRAVEGGAHGRFWRAALRAVWIRGSVKAVQLGLVKPSPGAVLLLQRPVQSKPFTLSLKQY